MAIFHHRDQVGDSLELLEINPQVLSLYMQTRGARCVDLPREAAIRLHNALGEWLYPTGVPVPNPDAAAINPADIRAMVAAQVAEIMALHQAPQAKYVDASGEALSDRWRCEECDRRYPECRCTPDPEPHDVGHPEPARPPLPVRNPFQGFVDLLTGIREAQKDMALMAAEAVQAARPHPEPDAEDGWEPVKATWDDELFAPEYGWTMCPCTRAVPKGAECTGCGHTRHLDKRCTARVRRGQS